MIQGNVLVVEDDDAVRGLLVEFLKRHSHLQVDSARDGVDALHQIASTSYTVVILDVMMPKMSGIDLLESLRAMMSDPSVKRLHALPAIIVITATSESILPAEVLALRFPELVRRVLRKPIEIDQLVKTVEDALSEGN